MWESHEMKKWESHEMKKLFWPEQPKTMNGNVVVFNGMSVFVCLSYVSNYSVKYSKLVSTGMYYMLFPEPL